MKMSPILFFFISLFSFVELKDFKQLQSIQVKNLRLIQCNDSINYPLSVSNVDVAIGTASKIKVSGSLFAQVDLLGPVRADLWIKRKVWGVWIPVPCEDNLGSCTYPDLCTFGRSDNKTCPSDFINNNVPCRCPILKGNYTINPSINYLSKQTSIVSGDYKGMVQITENSTLLSCYNVYFSLYDANQQSELEKGYEVNLI